jgi:GAF domain-containing protein
LRSTIRDLAHLQKPQVHIRSLPTHVLPWRRAHSIIHVSNIDGEDYEPAALERYRRISARAFLAVPIMHQGRPIGSVSVSRATVGPFSQRQINLLKTFADQAVIAVENTRLFEAEQARTREPTEALQQQTATADVLKVIISPRSAKGSRCARRVRSAPV